MSSEEKFLKILGLKPEKPDLQFLTRILDAHLRNVPWENVSKLLRKRDRKPSIPSFSEYVEGLRNNQFGETCHARNKYFAHLLKFLGFDASLVSAVPGGLPPSHVAVKIKLESQNYCIDVGLMSSFAGVFLLDPERPFEKTIAEQRFVFKPLPDKENWALQIYRGEKVVRSYQSTSSPLDSEEHAQAVRESFADSAYFMNVLAVHRCFRDYEAGIWNNKLYFNRGLQRKVHHLSSVDEISNAMDDALALPKFPLQEAVEVLNSNGVDVFAVTD